ncbi:hypothetical protein Btru_071068 [Bulinus truncatus]|nr:hypothetical protein Btru_071068 [Bulinus truncatus]
MSGDDTVRDFLRWPVSRLDRSPTAWFLLDPFRSNDGGGGSDPFAHFIIVVVRDEYRKNLILDSQPFRSSHWTTAHGSSRWTTGMSSTTGQAQHVIRGRVSGVAFGCYLLGLADDAEYAQPLGLMHGSRGDGTVLSTVPALHRAERQLETSSTGIYSIWTPWELFRCLSPCSMNATVVQSRHCVVTFRENNRPCTLGVQENINEERLCPVKPVCPEEASTYVDMALQNILSRELFPIDHKTVVTHKFVHSSMTSRGKPMTRLNCGLIACYVYTRLLNEVLIAFEFIYLLVDCPYGMWYYNCTNSCGENCIGDCNKYTGACSKCKSGFTHDFKHEHCQKECPPFTYGDRCSGSCLQKCGDDCADRTDGSCTVAQTGGFTAQRKPSDGVSSEMSVWVSQGQEISELLKNYDRPAADDTFSYADSSIFKGSNNMPSEMSSIQSFSMKAASEQPAKPVNKQAAAAQPPEDKKNLITTTDTSSLSKSSNESESPGLDAASIVSSHKGDQVSTTTPAPVKDSMVAPGLRTLLHGPQTTLLRGPQTTLLRVSSDYVTPRASDYLTPRFLRLRYSEGLRLPYFAFPLTTLLRASNYSEF